MALLEYQTKDGLLVVEWTPNPLSADSFDGTYTATLDGEPITEFRAVEIINAHRAKYPPPRSRRASNGGTGG